MAGGSRQGGRIFTKEMVLPGWGTRQHEFSFHVPENTSPLKS